MSKRAEPNAVAEDALVRTITALGEPSDDAAQTLRDAREAVRVLLDVLPLTGDMQRDDVQRRLWLTFEDVLERYGPAPQTHLLASAALASLLQDPRAWRRTGSLYHRLLEPSRAALLQDRMGKIGDLDATVVSFWEGVGAFVDGNAHHAMDLFAEAASHRHFHQLSLGFMAGATTCRTIPPYSRLAAGEPAQPLSPIRWLIAPRPTTGPTLVFTGDEVYWHAFAPGIVRTLRANTPQPRPNVHFHVIGNGGPDDALLDRLASEADEGLLLLSVSWEEASGGGRPYYAAARFLRLPELLDRVHRPVLLLDMDVVFTSQATALFDSFPSDRVVLGRTGPAYWGWLPWRSFWAGFVALPGSSEGREFAGLLRAACSYLWEDERSAIWWADQTSILYAYLAAMHGGSSDGIDTVAAYPAGIRSGERVKLAGLSRLPTVRQQLDSGVPWLQALKSVQERD